MRRGWKPAGSVPIWWSAWSTTARSPSCSRRNNAAFRVKREQGGVARYTAARSRTRFRADFRRQSRSNSPCGGIMQGSLHSNFPGGSPHGQRTSGPAVRHKAADRKIVVKGKSVSVRVDLGGRRSIKKNKKN